MAENQWFIRDVDEATKRKIKAYAASQGITIAKAIAEAALLLEKQKASK